MKTRCGLAAGSCPSRDCRARTRRGRRCARRRAAISAIVDAHAEIGLQRAEAEIEQDGARSSARSASRSAPSSVSTVRRLIAQSSCRQAERDALAPAGLVMLSNANGRHARMRLERDAAARRDRGNGVRRLRRGARLVAVAREFGDGAERAEAPLRLGIGDFPPHSR